jgi:hypothetical protein
MLSQGAIDNEFFPESEQEDSAKQEAKNDLHNIVIALRDTGIIIAQMLRDLEVRRPLDVDPIVEASTQWPVVYSKYPALKLFCIRDLGKVG